MSIDSQSKVIHKWDEVVLDEWKTINNEFGVLSNQPAKWEKEENVEKVIGKKKNRWSSKNHDKDHHENDTPLSPALLRLQRRHNEKRVFRNCFVGFNDFGIPVSGLRFFLVYDGLK